MTLQDLIEALQALPESARDKHVELEGCDCYGDCAGVMLSPWDDSVMILRAAGDFFNADGTKKADQNNL